MRRIVSYSVFAAREPTYWRSDRSADRISAFARFLPVAVRAHQVAWGAAWQMRIHHDDALTRHPYWDALERASALGLVTLVNCGPTEHLCLSMLWRLNPLWGDQEAVVACHDVDALPMTKNRHLAEIFCGMDKAVMTIHSCESHHGIMGGTSVYRASRFRQQTGYESLGDLSKARGPAGWDAYGSDEEFLTHHVGPKLTIARYPEDDDIRAALAAKLPEVPETDKFAPYIGSSGYSLREAFSYYERLGVGEIMRGCEKGIDVESVMRAGGLS